MDIFNLYIGYYFWFLGEAAESIRNNYLYMGADGP